LKRLSQIAILNQYEEPIIKDNKSVIASSDSKPTKLEYPDLSITPCNLNAEMQKRTNEVKNMDLKTVLLHNRKSGELTKVIK
jgi:hypothetical protein